MHADQRSCPAKLRKFLLVIPSHGMAFIMAWEEFRKKINMKRACNKPGNGASGGGVGNSILQSGEIIAQRMSAEVSGKAQKYIRIGARWTFCKELLQ